MNSPIRFTMTPVLSVAMDLPLEWVSRQTLAPCTAPEELSRLFSAVGSPQWITQDLHGRLTLKTGAHSQIADLELTLTEQRRQLSVVAVQQGLLPCCGSPAADRSIILQLGTGDGDTTLQLAQWWRPLYPLLYLILGEPLRHGAAKFLPTQLIRWKDYASAFDHHPENRESAEPFAIRPNARDGTLDIALNGVLPAPSQALELAAFGQTLTAYLLAEGPRADSQSLIGFSENESLLRATLLNLVDQLVMQSVALGTQSYVDAIGLRLAQSAASKSLSGLRTETELARTCLAWGEH